MSKGTRPNPDFCLTRSGKVAGKVLKLDPRVGPAKLLITLDSVTEWLRSRASNRPLGAPFLYMFVKTIGYETFGAVFPPMNSTNADSCPD